MEGGVPEKPVVVSDQFKKSRQNVYVGGIELFGFYQAGLYLDKILEALNTLPIYYNVYPECRHIVTKSRMYRNIILDSHLIVYRITDCRIEVLDIIHAASSMNRIKRTRRIKIE